MIEFLSPPPFEIAKVTSKKRWSEITPTNPALFVLFRLLRLLFGEYGRVAKWTRGWKTQWRMTILSTGYTETSLTREYLIDREHELFFKPRGDWLN